MISAFNQHITTTSSVVTTNESTEWTINTQGPVELITNVPHRKKKPCTHQQIVVMEEGHEDMEFDVLYNKMTNP
jgi:hypothetical protein